MTGQPKKFNIFKNKMLTILYPGSLFNMTITMGGVIAVRNIPLKWLVPIQNSLTAMEELLPLRFKSLRIFCVTTLTGLTIFTVNTYCRRLLLRRLLAWRGWMYDTPAKETMKTKIWAVFIPLLMGWEASMYSCQSCLPNLPMPPLDATLDKLLLSLEPIYENQPWKYTEMRLEVNRFKESIGYKLQRKLLLRSLWCDNYVSDWWEKYVYLYNRSPLPMNGNYYIMDQCYWTPTLCQCARAAGTLYQFLLVREQILAEDFEPLFLRKFIPTCMNQYRRVFSTTRVPGEIMDTLVNYQASESQHVVISRHGLLYMLEIRDSMGKLVTPGTLEKQFEWIRTDADSRFNYIMEEERQLSVLTSLERTSWARIRQEHFSEGTNKDVLHVIESAIVLIIAMNDGHIGLNCEHSYADAPVVAHIFEHNITFEMLTELYDSDGHCFDPHISEMKGFPRRLIWEVDEIIQPVIKTAFLDAKKRFADLDLVVYNYTEFGRGTIKKCKVSPDAFIQMCLNITYRKLTGVPVLIYEAATVRLYKHGRTETVRSLTKETNDFVRAFLDPERSADEKRAMFKIACERHVMMYKDAMNGIGIDRHLFALHIAGRSMGYDYLFLKKVLSLPWMLSTSQQPQQQISWAPSCQEPKFQYHLSPGGGFGPVANDGYGVSYMFPGELRIFFHVSSRRSAQGTDSSRFVETLKTTMKDFMRLYENFS